MTYVTLHAAWMVLAVVFGTVAGYQGLVRATMRPGHGSPLPGRFILKSHNRYGTVFFVMLYIGILYGWIMADHLLDGPHLPPRIGTVHIVLAASIGGLYGGAWIVGGALARRPAGKARAWPAVHMVMNYTACTLIAVQMGLAAYYVYIWPRGS